MAKRLLDRQVSLLECLTSGSVIFGNRATSPLNGDLRGIDVGLLRLQARLSHEKRMEKIVAVFSRTFEILGAKQTVIVREFVQAYPPTSISRLENARQFYDFVSDCWRRTSPSPPYLPDIAACEFAFAKAKADAEDRDFGKIVGETNTVRTSVRRHPGVMLLRCAYDIRPIFEENRGRVIPTKRDTPLAIVIPPGANQPRVFEILPVILDLLIALDNWTDPATLSGIPEPKEIIRELADHGFVESGTADENLYH